MLSCIPVLLAELLLTLPANCKLPVCPFVTLNTAPDEVLLKLEVSVMATEPPDTLIEFTAPLWVMVPAELCVIEPAMFVKLNNGTVLEEDDKLPKLAFIVPPFAKLMKLPLPEMVQSEMVDMPMVPILSTNAYPVVCPILTPRTKLFNTNVTALPEVFVSVGDVVLIAGNVLLWAGKTNGRTSPRFIPPV